VPPTFDPHRRQQNCRSPLFSGAFHFGDIVREMIANLNLNTATFVNSANAEFTWRFSNTHPAVPGKDRSATA